MHIPASVVCMNLRRAAEMIEDLTEACQLFTQGLGDDEGYYPALGAVKTKKAIDLMRAAGVEPIWWNEWQP